MAGDNEGGWKGGTVVVMSGLGASLVALELGRAEEGACRVVMDGS